MARASKQQKELEYQRQIIIDSFLMIRSDILYSKKTANITPYQEEQGFLISRQLLEENNCRKYIIDVTNATIFSRKSRHIVQQYLPEMSSLIDHVVIIISNPIFSSAIRFISNAITFDYKISIVQTLDEALEILEN